MAPCGCDPSTDLGGLKRLGYAVTVEKSLASDLYLLDLGNNFTKDTKDIKKEIFIQKGLDILNPKASLVNITELENLAHLGKRFFVLSNLKKNNENLHTQYEDSNALIWGFTFDPKNKIIEELCDDFSKELGEKWQKILASQKKEKILLLSAPLSYLKKFRNLNIFDHIILSNPVPLPETISLEEQKQVELLEHLLGDKIFFHVPLAASGILRLGGLEYVIPKTLEDTLEKKSDDLLATTQSLIFEPVKWLTKELDGPSDLDPLLKDYYASNDKAFEDTLKDRLNAHLNTTYVGSKLCQSCHAKAYEVWEGTRHAGAHETLVKKSRQIDPNCISCHVIGWDKGGFVSKADTPELINVGCESCHGGRKEHVQNPLKKPDVKAFEACKGCHVREHSPHFDKNSYWEKIKH